MRPTPSQATFRIDYTSGTNVVSPIGTMTLDFGTLRVPAGTGDYYVNKLIASNGGKVDFSGSTNFWLHLTGAGAGISVTSDATWTGGGTSRIQNDTGGTVDITVSSGKGLVASVKLTNGTSGFGFRVTGGGGLWSTAAGSDATILVANSSVYQFSDPAFVTTGRSRSRTNRDSSTADFPRRRSPRALSSGPAAHNWAPASTG